MGEQTAIGWTDHTFNPWWGCTRVSPGCQHCYAETFAKRTGHDVWGKGGERRFFGDKHWTEPLKWDRAAAAAGRPALVFCASMADVFEDREDLDEHRARLWDLVQRTEHLIWLLLTKRPENVLDMIPRSSVAYDGDWLIDGWPANVWIGTTVEDQQRADERIPHLLAVPAPVRFLSCEPLLGPLDLRPWLDPPKLRGFSCSRPRDAAARLGLPTVDWIIVGGESGAGHRPLDVDHARGLRAQADRAAVPFFFKQHGGRTPKAGGDLLDGRRHRAWPPEAHHHLPATTINDGLAR